MAFSAGARGEDSFHPALKLSLPGVLPLPPGCKDRWFVARETMHDADVVLVSHCAVLQALALLLAVHSSPAEWPGHVYYAAPLAHVKRTTNNLNIKAPHSSQFQCFYVKHCLEVSSFLG